MSVPCELNQVKANVTRIAGLDFIRGVAILLVLCRHLHLAQPGIESSWMHHVLFVLQRGGWCGVDLFFVLSGFLVSGILFRQYQTSGRLPIRDFLIRRGFKIYPAFWMLLEVTVIYNLVAGGTVPKRALCRELLFVQNYFEGLYHHTWSLAVEEHCYLGIVILLLICTRIWRHSANPFRILPFLAVIGLVTAGWLRCRLLPDLEKNGPPSILYPTHLRFDGFLAGVALGYFSCYRPEIFARLCRFGRVPWIVLGALLLLPVFVFDVRHDQIVIRWCLTTNIAAAVCWILAAHSRRSNVATVSHDASLFPPIWLAMSLCIEFIGVNSYSICLWHDLLEHLVARPLFGAAAVFPVEHPGTWVPVYLAVTLGGGILLAYLVERPALAWRDRWFPRKGPNS
ncbi:MAG: hypothetical protein JWM11_6962 [Planctomycetaceae bacterium]|nr:hypothetical protein [Planctomycetaceae bacterium]